MYRSARLPAALIGLAGLAGLALAQNTPRVPPYPRIENTIGYKVDPTCLKEKPPENELMGMSRVVVVSDGNVWTLNAYSPDGNLVKYWAGEPHTFKNPARTVR